MTDVKDEQRTSINLKIIFKLYILSNLLFIHFTMHVINLRGSLNKNLHIALTVQKIVCY